MTQPTSKLAREEHEARGRAESQRKLLLDAVQRNPGKTAGELATLIGLLCHEVGKRLPELRRDGHIVNGPARRCTVNNTQQMTWLPAVRRDAAVTAKASEHEKQQTLF